MAVIRQRQQVFSKPIGVTRMDTGEADLWKTVKAGADQLTSIAFREGQTIAEETGREAGLGAPMNEVLGVNPESGKVEPVSAPQGFGSIARRAYEKVVDARFMDEADSRLRLKAKELASKYKRSPTEFANQMSSFIAESAEKTADGKYKNIILDNGKKYLSDMHINLMDQARSRARVREAELGNYNLLEGVSHARDAAEQGDYGLAAELSQQQIQRAKDLYDADLISISELRTHQTNYKTSVAQGVIQDIFTRMPDELQRKNFMLYLRTGGADGEMPPVSLDQSPKWNSEKGRFINPLSADDINAAQFMLLPRMLTDRMYRAQAFGTMIEALTPFDEIESMEQELDTLDDSQKRNRSYLDDSNAADIFRFAEALDARKSNIENIERQRAAAELVVRQNSLARNQQLETLRENEAFGGQASQFLEGVLQSAQENPDLTMLAGGEGQPTSSDIFGGVYNALQAASSGLSSEVRDRIAGFEQRFEDGEEGYTIAKLRSDRQEVQRSGLNALLDLGLSDGNSDKLLSALNGGSTEGLTTVQVAVVQGIRSNEGTLVVGDMGYVGEYISQNKDSALEKRQDNVLQFQAATLGNDALNSAATRGWQGAYDLFISESSRLGVQEGALSGPEFRIQQAMIRKAWAKSIVDTNYSAMSQAELTDLRTAVATKKIDPNISEYSQRVAEQIKGIAREDLNVEAITGHIDTLINAKVKENNRERQANIISNRLTVGDMGSTKEQRAETALAADQAIILNVLGLEAGDADDPAVISNAISEAMLSPESMAPDGETGFDAATASDQGMIRHQVQQNIMRGIISQGFVDNLKGIAIAGQQKFTDDEVALTMQHFANLAFYKDQNGQNLNLLMQFEDILGKETLSKLESVHHASKLLGSNNMRGLLLQMDDNAFDPAFQDRMKIEFKSGTAFMGEDDDMKLYSGEARDMLANSAKYLWMATGGNPEAVTQGLKSMYEEKFANTNGYVFDSSHMDGSKSRFAPSIVFPQEPVRDAFLNHVATTFANNTEHPVTGKPYTFGANSSGIITSEFAALVSPRLTQSYNIALSGNKFTMGEGFLHPIEKSSDGTVYYQAYEVNEFGSFRPILTKEVKSKDGKVISGGAPMYFTSKEPYLNKIRKNLGLQELAESKVMTNLIENKKAREVEQGIVEGGPASGRSVLGSDAGLTEALMARRNQ